MTEEKMGNIFTDIGAVVLGDKGNFEAGCIAFAMTEDGQKVVSAAYALVKSLIAASKTEKGKELLELYRRAYPDGNI